MIVNLAIEPPIPVCMIGVLSGAKLDKAMSVVAKPPLSAKPVS